MTINMDVVIVSGHDAPPGVIPWTQVRKYLDCPQRYWYAYRAGLSERGDRSYVHFYDGLYSTLSLAVELRTQSKSFSTDTLKIFFDEAFDTSNVRPNGHTAVLRQKGNLIIERFSSRLNRLSTDRKILIRPWVCVTVGNTTIGLRPAEVEYLGDSVTVARLHFFKPYAESHHERHDVALLYAALGMSVQVEFWYPMDDVTPIPCALESRRPEALPPKSRKEPISVVVAKQIALVGEVVARLEAERFEPTPDEHACGGCGYQYCCPGLNEEFKKA